MHEFIVKRNEKGLLNIKAATFSDMQFSKFDVPEENLEKEMENIRTLIRICFDTNAYKTQVNFRFI